MSDLYINQLKKQNGCLRCVKSKLKHKGNVYSLCRSHLNEAAKKWRSWQEQRREDCKCCYCDRKSFKGYLRCKTHTIYNRQKCSRWMKEHPDAQERAYKLRTTRFLNKGLCLCIDHSPTYGYRVCEKCRIKARLAPSAIARTKKSTVVKLKNKLKKLLQCTT